MAQQSEGIIAAIVSVPRGACAREPVRYELSPEEEEAIAKLEEKKEPKLEEIPGFPKKLWFRDDEDEPAMDMDDEDEDDEEDDKEDTEIRETDAIFLCAKTEEDLSSVEMYIYDDNLYVHHDITLPAYPLALEWLRLTGSFVAVGTFETAIEIWNLDVLDALEPTVMLGESDLVKKKKSKESHTDAVAALAWNRRTTNTLASGSADQTVKLWDLDETKCASSFAASGRVQTLQFHPKEAAALAYGGDDNRVHVRDCRSKNAVRDLPSLSGDIESLAWHPQNGAHLVASSDAGDVVCFDVRFPTNGPVWTLGQPHGKKAVPAVAFNDAGMLATCSHDKTVQLFDVRPTTSEPRLAIKSMAVGKLFALAFDDGDPFLLATAGSTASLALWETTENANVAAFQRDVQGSGGGSSSAGA